MYRHGQIVPRIICVDLLMIDFALLILHPSFHLWIKEAMIVRIFESFFHLKFEGRSVNFIKIELIGSGEYRSVHKHCFETFTYS